MAIIGEASVMGALLGVSKFMVGARRDGLLLDGTPTDGVGVGPNEKMSDNRSLDVAAGWTLDVSGTVDAGAP